MNNKEPKTEPKNFDIKDQDSPFYSHVRSEFYHGRGTEHRKKLSKKHLAPGMISHLDIKIPEKYAILDDIRDLRGLNIPDSFVLKYAHGWSNSGVMILQRVSEGRYFCHLAQRILRLEEIEKKQTNISHKKDAKPSWIVEELVKSTISGKPIPLDYKFYCFRDEIGLIVQVDRNTFPPKITLLDGNFIPFVSKQDFVLTSRQAQLGTPLVPLNAHGLAYWAKTLSCLTDSPFVSIDLYDSPAGPYFGEFTFSPGAVAKRMWRLERRHIAKLDSLYRKATAKVERLEREEIPGSAALHDLPAEIYSILASALLNGSPRAANRLRTLHGETPEGGVQPGIDLGLSWERIEALIARQQKNSLGDREVYFGSHKSEGI